MNQNLRTFLLNRIADEELAARRVIERGPLSSGEPITTLTGAEIFGARGLMFPADRVLAECAAKRSIVENLWAGIAEPTGGSDPSGTERLWVLRTLATVYADHPEFREEWRA